MRHKDPALMDRISEFITSFYLDHNRTPSTTEIAEEVGTTRVSAYRYLVAMDQKGLLSYKNGEIMTESMRKILVDCEPAAALGKIACGDPILAVENHDGAANIPADSSADFALRCTGDSMINARIFPGDLVLIRQQSDVENGEIAAVLVDGEATLKRVFKYAGRVELRPENPLYPIINVEGPALDSFRILGKAISFISEVR